MFAHLRVEHHVSSAWMLALVIAYYLIRVLRKRFRTSATLRDMDTLTQEAMVFSNQGNIDPAGRWSQPVDKPRRRRRPRTVHTPCLSHPSVIVSAAEHLTSLQSAIPSRFQSCDWQCVYSTMQHGVSLQTFYNNCEGPDPVVVLIRDSNGHSFGCYNTGAWRQSQKYYGTGEGFVFTIKPELKIYKWSRENSYFQLGRAGSIAMGGGGKFALFLDSMFERGSSGPCATFNSPCLASSSEFDVIVLEAYKVVPSYKVKPQG